MFEFPYLIFRKCCYFCQKRDDCQPSEYDLCTDFVLREDLARFLDTEIFDEVVKAMERRRGFIRADGLRSSPHPAVGEERNR